MSWGPVNIFFFLIQEKGNGRLIQLVVLISYEEGKQAHASAKTWSNSSNQTCNKSHLSWIVRIV